MPEGAVRAEQVDAVAAIVQLLVQLDEPESDS